MKKIDIRTIGRGHYYTELDMNALTSSAHEKANNLFLDYEKAVAEKDRLLNCKREHVAFSEEWNEHSDKVYEQWDKIGEIEEQIHALSKDKSNFKGIHMSEVLKGIGRILDHKYTDLTLGLAWFVCAYGSSVEGELFNTMLFAHLSLGGLKQYAVKSYVQKLYS